MNEFEVNCPMEHIAIVGAGVSGVIIAHELAKRGHRIDVFESRPQVAGNCHTDRDPDTGVMVHFYGPHISDLNWRQLPRHFFKQCPNA
jgi:UDP-galactopyranose mutase